MSGTVAINATIHLNVTKATILIASFMVTGMGRREGYSSISTSPVTFNSFHDSKLMGVKR